METASTATLDRLDAAGQALLFTEARTANSFAPIPVADEELAAIWDLAKWPPTAANIQPLRVLYVRSGEAKARLVTYMNEGNQAKTAAAPAVAVLAVDSRFHEHIPTVLPYKPELQDALEADVEMRDGLGRLSAGLQIGYFLLAVRARGLAAGPMGGFDQAAVDADFFPGGRLRSLLVVNIGHPGESPWRDRLPRLDTPVTVSWA